MQLQTGKNTTAGANYLGLSFQMGVFIFLCTYGGLKLDKKIGTKFLFTLLFAVLAIVLSLYYIIHKETYKNKKDE